MSSETDVQAIQDQLADLKQRMHALEQAEIQLRKVAVGPRGPQGTPGPYTEGPQGPKGQQGERGNRGTDGKDGKDGRDGKDGHTLSYDELNSMVHQTLMDYGVLDSDARPYAGPYSAAALEELKK